MNILNVTAMGVVSEERSPGALHLVKCKCPRCRRGDMFMERSAYKLKSTLKMYENCPVCGQPFDLEVGFYYGSSYISYALSIAISAASLIAYWLLIGFSTQDNRFFYWIIFNSVLLIGLQPILMRMARCFWLAFFVRYDKDWRTKPTERLERVNNDQKNNW
jgi:uncharacterized protein (DUF983 family)